MPNYDISAQPIIGEWINRLSSSWDEVFSLKNREWFEAEDKYNSKIKIEFKSINK